jgi:hypothetical protein
MEDSVLFATKNTAPTQREGESDNSSFMCRGEFFILEWLSRRRSDDAESDSGKEPRVEGFGGG